MAQTISELEKERAELLKAIELQAQQLSSDRQGQDDPSDNLEKPEHSLKDWLHAAEEVMPSSSRSQTPPNPSMPKSTQPNTLNTKASFFGVIIMLSLLLTILGVVYIAYSAIQKELSSVSELNHKTAEALQVLKQDVSKIQQGMAGQGQGSRFEALQNRVDELERELAALKLASKSVGAQSNLNPSSATGAHDASSATGEPTVSLVKAQLPENVVTTDVLDAKLQEYTRGIERKLEQILNVLPAAAQAVPQEQSAMPSAKRERPESALSGDTGEIKEPASPHVKPMNQPVVRLVQKIQSPTSPETPDTTQAPLEHYTSDVKWLQSQPLNSFTLQLASMSEQASLEKLVTQKGLEDTRIIPQDRNGNVRFVLITGQYSSRSNAENAAAKLESEFGISPWVRRVKDLTTKLK